MGTGIFNIVIGGVMIVGGAMGELALLGTNSSPAIVVVGVIVAGMGVVQIIKLKRR